MLEGILLPLANVRVGLLLTVTTNVIEGRLVQVTTSVGGSIPPIANTNMKRHSSSH